MKGDFLKEPQDKIKAVSHLNRVNLVIRTSTDAYLERLAGRIKHELQHGSGVVWLKSICNSEFHTAQKKLFYLAIGEAMGSTMGNYGRLYDVRDRGGSYKKQPIPVSQTHATTGFHTDSSALNTMPDVVALLCLRPAHTGGEIPHRQCRKNS